MSVSILSSNWSICEDVQAMLQHLNRDFPDRFSDRQRRLFACGCCRLVWDKMKVWDQRKIVLAEHIADYGSESLPPSLVDHWSGVRFSDDARPANSCIFESAWEAVVYTSARLILGSSGFYVAQERQAAVLRDIVDSPYIHHISPFPNRNTREFRAAQDLAAAIYISQSFEQTPVLADAVMDAGCTDEDFMRHLKNEERCPHCHGLCAWLTKELEMEDCEYCQGKGWIQLRSPHVRGCWAIDMLRGAS